MIAPREARDQMDRASKLARFIGGDTLRSYERGIEMFEQKTTGGGRAVPDAAVQGRHVLVRLVHLSPG